MHALLAKKNIVDDICSKMARLDYFVDDITNDFGLGYSAGDEVVKHCKPAIILQAYSKGEGKTEYESSELPYVRVFTGSMALWFPSLGELAARNLPFTVWVRVTPEVKAAMKEKSTTTLKLSPGMKELMPSCEQFGLSLSHSEWKCTPDLLKGILPPALQPEP